MEKLVRPLRQLTPLEQERAIHDFICENVRYDKLKKPYSHEIIGPLGQGVGVCEGIAKSVKILCDALGLWCMIAVSENNPPRASNTAMPGTLCVWMGSTTTWTPPLTLPSASPVSCAMTISIWMIAPSSGTTNLPSYPLPACTDAARAFYRAEKRSFTKIEDVCKRAQMPLRKDQPFLFHWRGGALNREILLELVRALEETAQTRGRHAAVSYNYPQAVLCVRFPGNFPGRNW